METNLKEGDQVKLKSGGPTMTIDSIDENASRASCAWFDEKKTLQTAKFALHTLVKYEPSSSVGSIFIV